MKLPEKIKIINTVIGVKTCNAPRAGNEYAKGSCYTNDEGRTEIIVDKNLEDDAMFETFIHEVLEHINFEYQVFHGDKWHGDLEIVASLTARMLLDNFDLRVK